MIFLLGDSAAIIGASVQTGGSIDDAINRTYPPVDADYHPISRILNWVDANSGPSRTIYHASFYGF